MSEHRIFVTAPATSANLGPGFDTLALALELRNEVIVTRGTGRVVVAGEGAATLRADAGNYVARCFAEALAPDNAADAWDLRCVNRIPLARGLGSSAAAAATGILAAWGTNCLEARASLEELWENRLMRDVTRLDGHGDNAAACAFGGVCAYTGEGNATKLAVSDAPAFAVVVPQRELATTTAREALSAHVTHAQAATGIGATAGVITALGDGATDRLSHYLHADQIHEPARAHLVPELAAVRALGRACAGFLGATLSGAGPSVLVWCASPSARDGVVQELRDHSSEHADWRVEPYTLATSGATLQIDA